MRITAAFSDGLRKQLDGRAIGDEFDITAHARIVAAEEALIDVTALGALETQVLQGELEVTLLLSHGKVMQAATNDGEATAPAKGSVI